MSEELLDEAILDIGCYAKRELWTLYIKRKQYSRLLNSIVIGNYLRKLNHWKEEDLLQLLRFCGAEPTVRRRRLDNQFYWYLDSPTARIKPLDFNLTLEFDQCMNELKLWGYRKELNKVLPSEVTEHILSYT